MTQDQTEELREVARALFGRTDPQPEPTTEPPTTPEQATADLARGLFDR